MLFVSVMTKTSWSSLIVIVISLISIYIIYRAIYPDKEGYTDCISYRADGTVGECDYGGADSAQNNQQLGMSNTLSVGSWSGGRVEPASEVMEISMGADTGASGASGYLMNAVAPTVATRNDASITRQRKQYSDNILAQSGVTNVKGVSVAPRTPITRGSILGQLKDKAQSVITSVFGTETAPQIAEDEAGMVNIGIGENTGAGGGALWETRRGGTQGGNLSEGNWCGEGEKPVGEICCALDNSISG